jgi:phospholipid transport system transporter-binding protein
MPAADAAASVGRDGEALRFAGALSRDQVPALWRQALPLLAGVRRFDLAGASRVDSAGVALLAELASRAGNAGTTGGSAIDAIAIDGNPPGLAELRAAYRLKPDLDFA